VKCSVAYCIEQKKLQMQIHETDRHRNITEQADTADKTADTHINLSSWNGVLGLDSRMQLLHP